MKQRTCDLCGAGGARPVSLYLYGDGGIGALKRRLGVDLCAACFGGLAVLRETAEGWDPEGP